MEVTRHPWHLAAVNFAQGWKASFFVHRLSSSCAIAYEVTKMSTLQQKKNGLITGIYSIKCNSISTLSRPTVVCFVFFLFEIFLLPFYVHWIQLVDVCGPGFRNFTHLVSILFCLFFFPWWQTKLSVTFCFDLNLGKTFLSLATKLWQRSSCVEEAFLLEMGTPTWRKKVASADSIAWFRSDSSELFLNTTHDEITSQIIEEKLKDHSHLRFTTREQFAK